ncbi:LLM class flavin-dependent oxidoreductase [Streptomyces ipomoeae]|jgi:FMN-dependent oxidoreductase (nitrilotriacetate monooxygenase family)|uniref:LLM class flavin-dependent oxidoreductase n=1 Tax=Streptomyces ipomoeae TaxID=103232 RepID=UPI0029BAAD40|nr:LLM class flavin-dependent oxidoreductase [Streptomyces ipomoeae]MDX2821778.1 LLM class flavin-dependent oxidoreductase [Streptomyces ipomoeae]
MSERRRLHLNAFLMEADHHEAAWRLPHSNPRADFDLRHWIELARLAESAKFDSLFLADGPALIGTGEFRPPGQLEPLTLLTALSQATSRIGLIATVSSTYNEPYNLARRLASVDHVSGGRAGWNIVTSAGADEAANFGLDDRPGHAELPHSRIRSSGGTPIARADEFLKVAKALWDSWESEAVVADRTTGRYADPARLHRLDHQGRYFKVAGPLNVERPPQGYPLLVQAGSSEDGKDFAARHAEAIFTAHTTYERAAAFYADIKARTRAAGRDPGGVIVLPGIVPYIGSTEEEARALARQFDELRVPEYGLRQLAAVFETEPSVFQLDEPLPDFILARPKLEGSQSRSDLIIDLAVREQLTVRQVISRLGGGRGHFEFVGTPEQVADTIIAWFEGGAADGFNIMAPALPSGLAAFVEHVLPILRGKGLFREEYEGTTLREHYGLPLPRNQFHD